jgi:hypothetical protein
MPVAVAMLLTFLFHGVRDGTPGGSGNAPRAAGLRVQPLPAGAGLAANVDVGTRAARETARERIRGQLISDAIPAG